MKILYIFPHPDDESFGPAAAIHQQIKEGNEVILLTFTKGGATKVRHKLGLSVQEMGNLREMEMHKVKTTLAISAMTILDYEDGGLANLNPLELEEEVKKWLTFYQPNIVVTYPVHGGSGHHDHIALHHAIKRIYYEQIPEFSFWKRLAFFTVIDTEKPMFLEGGVPRVTQTKQEDISVIINLNDDDINAMKHALLCYDTYQEMVNTTHVIERIGNKTYFELASEKFDIPLSSLTEKIIPIIEKTKIDKNLTEKSESIACCGGPPVNNEDACCKLDEDKKANSESGCGCETDIMIKTISGCC